MKNNNQKLAFFITSDGWGGLEMNVLNLASSLFEIDYDITFFTSERSTIYEKVKDTFSTVLVEKNRKYFDFKCAKIVAKHLIDKEIKTVLVSDNKDIDVISWVKKLYCKDLKFIYQQQMQIGLNKKGFIHTIRFKSIDHWISPLEWLRDEIKERTKFPVDRVHIIPLGVDVEKFSHRKYTKEEALKKLNIAPKAPLMGVIGRISERKGQLFLVESLIKLRKKGVQVELMIFGSPTINDPSCHVYHQKILNLVQENDLQEVVHFVDFKEDTLLFYNSVDIAIMATDGETYGMVTSEAMSAGVPIIGNDSGGTSELLGFGEYGLLYENQNHRMFCEKLEWVLNHVPEMFQKASLAQKRVKEKYSKDFELKQVDLILKGNKKYD